MLGFFPSVYPDEILYSVWARFQKQVQYSDKKSIVRELFGTSNALAVIDLPSHLNSFVANLPVGHCIDVDNLIDANTLFPFYSPFHPRSRSEKLRRSMKSDRGVSIHGQLGLMANTVPSVEWLKFCPICAEFDRQTYGECYWHRLHQVPGVAVCQRHMVFLENSAARLRHRKTRHEFVSAEETIETVLSRSLSLSNSFHLALLKIASDAAWLLEQRSLAPGLELFRKRYLRLLTEQGLASYGGRVLVSELLEAFTCFHSVDLLAFLHCELDRQSHHNWLFRLVRSPKSAQHPLHHLLLIHFLGYTAESFFKLPGKYYPFGKGPWLCLNPVCANYRTPKLNQYRLSYSRDTGRPIGTFGCSCGFVYSRLGPDQSSKDLYRFSRVETYGAVWEEALGELWANTTLSLREIARRFEADPNTIKKHALRLNLPFPRPAKRATQQVPKPLSSTVAKAFAEDPSQEMVTNREEWLLLRKTYPQAGGRFLRQQSPKVYTWLYRNDRGWLAQHMPPRQMAASPPRVNWEERDAKLAAVVRSSAEGLRNMPGKPVQVTVAAIAREAGELPLIQKRLSKLPKTAAALAEVAESREEFALRRIRWITEYFRVQGIQPKRWEIIRRAGLRPDTEKLPKVAEEIALALESLTPDRRT